MTEKPPARLLSPEELSTLRERYNLPSIRTWHRTPKGNTHTTWVLRLADDRTAVLRRYHPSFDEDAVRYEHSILTHLAERGFPVARIIPAADDRTFVSVDGGRYAIFEYCEGSPRSHFLLRRSDRTFIASAAALLAHYHHFMEGFTPEGRRVTRGGGWFCAQLDRLEERLRSADMPRRQQRLLLAQCEALKEQLHAVGARLEAHDGRHSETIIHGDFGPSHLLVRRGRITAVLDFANARRDMRVADVGRSLVEFSKGPGPWVNLAIGRVFLRAYQAGNPLHPDDLALLPEWMIHWRLISLYYALKRYVEQRRLACAARALWSLKLVDWLGANRTQMLASLMNA